MNGYNCRIIDDMLKERLETMGAVLLEGVMPAMSNAFPKAEKSVQGVGW